VADSGMKRHIFCCKSVAKSTFLGVAVANLLQILAQKKAGIKPPTPPSEGSVVTCINHY